MSLLSTKSLYLLLNCFQSSVCHGGNGKGRHPISVLLHICINILHCVAWTESLLAGPLDCISSYQFVFPVLNVISYPGVSVSYGSGSNAHSDPCQSGSQLAQVRVRDTQCLLVNRNPGEPYLYLLAFDGRSADRFDMHHSEHNASHDRASGCRVRNSGGRPGRRSYFRRVSSGRWTAYGT